MLPFRSISPLSIARSAPYCLYGADIYQLWWYMNVYHRNDRTVTKFFVYCTFFLETLLTVACVHACYYHLVTKSSNPTSLAQGVWSFDSIPLLSGLTVCVAQCFFAFRVYMLRPKYRPLATTSVLFSLAACAFTASSIAKISKATLIHPKAYILDETLALASAAFSDTLTTSVLVVVLKQSRTGLKTSDRLIDRLILYSVNTGLLTVIFDIVAVSVANARVEDLIGVGISIVGANMYTISLLAMLNARRSLADELNRGSGELISISLKPLSFTHSPNDPPCPNAGDTWSLRRSHSSHGSASDLAVVPKSTSWPVLPEPVVCVRRV
ncbi:hypothetical protein C8Q77DRAFT_874116 [Trametes polyzona]|nr:hypothetical protein C8Q77DRAFT_874116 [Trametes polyzona]